MQHLLLLHGAIGSREQLASLAEKLSLNFKTHAINFYGHGGDAIPESEFSIELFAGQVLEYLEQHNISRASVFGYSMGGYVATWLAVHHPEKFDKIITLATKFLWTETIAANEVSRLDPGKIQQKIPAFAAQLSQQHAPQSWITVLDKTKAMLLQMGNNNPLKPGDFSLIRHPCLLLLGADDKMVSSEETEAVARQIPNAQNEILPGTGHSIELVDKEILADKIEMFCYQ
jgi:pimeloyl-ACP methyl ester carboxylesterase